MKIRLDQLRSDLFKTPSIPDTPHKKSGVIIPILFDSDSFLLTRRSVHLKHHAGQISFPGGTMEDNDENLLETALREWEEEMGESRDRLSVQGEFERLETGTGFHISSYVAIYSGNQNFRLSDEVDSVLQVSLQDLQNADFYSVDLVREGRKRTAHYFDLQTGLLWGATAELLIRFCRKFTDFDRIPTPVKSNLAQPPFLDVSVLKTLNR